MYDEDILNQEPIYCMYDELYKTGYTYCKFTKSTQDIADLCVENHYLNYNKLHVVDDKTDGHHFISFAPLEKAVLLIPYGDTYTQLHTGYELSNMYCHNVPVRRIGAMFDEHISPEILVDKNISLRNISINQFVIRNADNDALLSACSPMFSFAKISRHMDKLGFSDACEFWEEIEQACADLKKEFPITRDNNKDFVTTKLKEEFAPQQDLTQIIYNSPSR